MRASKSNRPRRCWRARLSVALLGLGLVAAAHAQTLRDGRPDVYTVVRGDTLWDISGRFLNEPWLWPEIWEANPQIENPHLIYPGDEISLVYVSGRPRLRLRRGGREVVRLSPQVRVSRRGKAPIPTIPVEAISQFLNRPRVVEQGQLDRSPYIVSVGKEHLIAGEGFRVYARGDGLADESRFTVYRQGSVYRDPDNGNEVIGYEAIHLGDAVVERTGDPATILLLQTEREVLSGDRLLPAYTDQVHENFQPRSPPSPVTGRIIEVVEGVTQIGQYRIVVLNLGERNGISPGHVLAVYQQGDTIVDDYQIDPALEKLKPSERAFELMVRDVRRAFGYRDNLVTLPEERAGTIMVFRAYDRISYALVMDAERPMHILDSVKNP